MTSLKYEEVFSYFLGNMTDYKFSSLDEENSNELMSEYLHKTIGNSYVNKLFSYIKLDDTNLCIDYELRDDNDFANEEFVKDVLSKGMVCEWLKPKVRSTTNTALLLGGKEQKWFSQANHLSELRNLLHDTEVELKKFISNRGYISDVYSGE